MENNAWDDCFPGGTWDEKNQEWSHDPDRDRAGLTSWSELDRLQEEDE